MCNRLLSLGRPLRRSYVVPMRWMVIYEYEVPGGALNLSSTKLPRPWSPLESSLSRKNPHGGTGKRTRDLMIRSQKLLPLDHEAGPTKETGNSVYMASKAVPQLTQSAASHCGRPFLNLGQRMWSLFWMTFICDVYLPVLLLSSGSVIPPTLHSQSFIYHRTLYNLSNSQRH
jgi:hypothetical protein